MRIAFPALQSSLLSAGSNATLDEPNKWRRPLFRLERVLGAVLACRKTFISFFHPHILMLSTSRSQANFLSEAFINNTPKACILRTLRHAWDALPPLWPYEGKPSNGRWSCVWGLFFKLSSHSSYQVSYQWWNAGERLIWPLSRDRMEDFRGRNGTFLNDALLSQDF